MKGAGDLPLVTTIKERCRVCYACARECPARAIRIAEGQPEVVDQRCIGCGNCVRVCSQNAKLVMGSKEPTADLLRADGRVAAGIAHDINSPLGVVLMYAHILLGELGQESEFGEDVALIADQGKLTVRIEGDEAHCRLSVTDTGVGIREDALGKVFEPFFTTKPMGQGTGLGLAVTYGIVKMHRGDIQVTSNSDPSKGPAGTTFTVTLPRSQRRTEEQTVG